MSWLDWLFSSRPHGTRRPPLTLEAFEERLTPTTLPAGFTETLVASGLTAATSMDFAPDGRLFVTLQGGDLRVVKNGSLLPTPFVSLSVNSQGERGLLGVTFDPAFTTNHFVYVYYTTAASPIHNRISRFTANGDVAAPGSETVLMDLDNLSSAVNHNGGSLHFGPDGKLYIGVGENGLGSNAQTLANRLGKMLRINSDGTIPTDNPFFSTATGANRAIWALGLRNPFTFGFQPGTGRMFIDDVGESTWEEIDDGIAGSNYGWPTTEGPTTNPAFRAPLFAYMHGTGPDQGDAITGGVFYDPATQSFPADYKGDYFFSDLTNNWIHRYDQATGTVQTFATDVASGPVDLDVDPAGNLYYLSHNTGAVFRISFTAPPSPPVVPPPPPTANADKLGAYRPTDGSWSLDADGNGVFTPADTVYLNYSPPGVVPIRGDWNGDGRDEVGFFKDGQWHFDVNGDGMQDTGDATASFGKAGDIPVVGNFFGTGLRIGVFSSGADGVGRFVIDANNDRVFDDGDSVIVFGRAGDRVVVGDWNGDGRTKVGVLRPNDDGSGTAVFSLDTNGDFTFDTGDAVFVYGVATDNFVVGDWNGDGTTKVGVYRPDPDGSGRAYFSLDTNGNQHFDPGTDAVIAYGLATDTFLTGNWHVNTTSVAAAPLFNDLNKPLA